MIQFILMLLGLAFPNSNANTVKPDNQNPVNIENMQSVTGDTGGETTPIPPKK